MKKQYYFLFFSFLFQLHLYAQEYSTPSPVKQTTQLKKEKKFDIGLSVGLNLSNISFKDADTTYSNDFDARVGAHFGIKVQYNIDEYFSIRSGFDLKARGYKRKETINVVGRGATESTFLYKTTYLDIPLTLQVNLNPGNPTGLFIRGGAYYALAVEGNYRFKFSDDNISIPPNATGNIDFGEGVDSDQKRTDTGIIIGGGLKVKIVEIAAVWDFGLANIAPVTTNGEIAKNRLFRLNVIVWIP